MSNPSENVPVIPLPTSLSNSPRISNIVAKFKARYSKTPLYLVRVPGRVNIIGEHIDYCGYAVFPMAIQQDITMAFALNQEDKINLANTDEHYEPFSCSVDKIQFDVTQKPKWHHYFLCGYRGAGEKFNCCPGIDVLVDGVLPAASGVSSSSAMVCSSALVTSMAYNYSKGISNPTMSKLEMASLCAKSEHWIGTDSGGMDQAIAITAEEGFAKIIEFLPSLSVVNVPLPSSGTFFISHSGVQMNKAASGNYNTRVAETRLAAAIIAKKSNLADYKIGDQLSTVQKLLGKELKEMGEYVRTIFDEKKLSYTREDLCAILEISLQDLEAKFLNRLTFPVEEFHCFQRALHVYEEAARVYQFRDIALSIASQSKGSSSSASDLQLLGSLMSESHMSCKDLYDCSHEKLDELVEIALASGAVGSRLTGAGWGGCIVSLVPNELCEQFENNLNKFTKLNCKSKPDKGAVIYQLALDNVLDQINENHQVMVNKLASLEREIEQVKLMNDKQSDSQKAPGASKKDVEKMKQGLRAENEKLKVQIQGMISQLSGLESKRLGKVTSSVNEIKDEKIGGEGTNIQTGNELKAQEKKSKPEGEQADINKRKPKEPKPKASPKPKEEDRAIDVSRLDLRVGRILSAEKHPDAESLYVEQIDCGEEKPRTVVSGLVKFVPLEEMQDRLVIVLCNLKPAKMRGITSEAMVMCASTPDKVEILRPPPDAKPGEKVSFGEYPGEADDQLNPKKKIWEQIAPDLKTDNDGVANYKGSVFKVAEKGIVKADTLKNVQVK